jgi:hypothetical protein
MWLAGWDELRYRFPAGEDFLILYVRGGGSFGKRR